MGEDVQKDIPAALQFLTAAAEQSNQYAQYTLGKLYLMGKDIPRNKESAVRWFTLYALLSDAETEGENPYTIHQCGTSQRAFHNRSAGNPIYRPRQSPLATHQRKNP